MPCCRVLTRRGNTDLTRAVGPVQEDNYAVKREEEEGEVGENGTETDADVKEKPVFHSPPLGGSTRNMKFYPLDSPILVNYQV